MVTTIDIDTVGENDVQKVYAEAIQVFEKMLRDNGCQMINVTASEVTHSFCAHKQVITVIWTGETSEIHPKYYVQFRYGMFGTIVDVHLLRKNF